MMKDEFELETTENLFRLVHRLRSMVIKELHEVDDRISIMHIRSLKFIAGRQPVTQQDLVETFKRDKGQIARLVDDMVKLDLLTKHPDERDRRSVNLSLTVTGEKLFSDFKKKERKKFKVLLKGLDEKQVSQLNSSLQIMSDNLK
jgi:DNA-binding MarR family transcriptional regulator